MNWNILAPLPPVSGKDGPAAVYCGPGLNPRIGAVIYADFDGTLFEMSKRSFAGVNVVPIVSVISALGRLATAYGAEIVIVTNQKWKVSADDIRMRLENGLQVLLAQGLPVVAIYASLIDDGYRKPMPGIPMHATANFAQKPLSLIVGDAAGRAGDHSCCDRKLAHNIGAEFLTPEELCGQPKAQFSWGLPTPEYVQQLTYFGGGVPPIPPPRGPELIVMCGFPGSGKSSIAKILERRAGYRRLSADELGSSFNKAISGLRRGESVVIDRVHASVKSRAEYAALAAQLGLFCRCVCIVEPVEVSYHKMMARAALGGPRIDVIVYRTQRKSFAEPTSAEGFHEIVRLDGRIDLDAYADNFPPDVAKEKVGEFVRVLNYQYENAL